LHCAITGDRRKSTYSSDGVEEPPRATGSSQAEGPAEEETNGTLSLHCVVVLEDHHEAHANRKKAQVDEQKGQRVIRRFSGVSGP
jgi:hypothetical protein